MDGESFEQARIRGALRGLDRLIPDQWAKVQEYERKAPVEWRSLREDQWPKPFREAWAFLNASLDRRLVLMLERDFLMDLYDESDS